MSVFRTAATGNGPISETFEIPEGSVYRAYTLALHLNAAPTTSENLTITLDAVDGPNYDTVLHAQDLSATAVTDLELHPEEALYLMGGDGLDVAWANSDGRTWGLLLTMESVQ